jgi:hypothetical protein
MKRAYVEKVDVEIADQVLAKLVKPLSWKTMNRNAMEETGLREGLCSGRGSVQRTEKCEHSNKKKMWK